MALSFPYSIVVISEMHSPPNRAARGWVVHHERNENLRHVRRHIGRARKSHQHQAGCPAKDRRRKVICTRDHQWPAVGASVGAPPPQPASSHESPQ
eukprot:5784683-Pyramimonas_sp.AAC.1